MEDEILVSRSILDQKVIIIIILIGKKKQFIKEKCQKKCSKVHRKYTKKRLEATQKTKGDTKDNPS